LTSNLLKQWADWSREY